MRYFFYGFLFLAVISCSQKKPLPEAEIQRPDTLISREQMIRVITDVHLAEAAISYVKNKGSQTKYVNEDYLNVVFEKYKISKETFTSNFNYYKQDQADFLKMYEKVIRNLDEMKRSVKPADKQ